MAVFNDRELLDLDALEQAAATIAKAYSYEWSHRVVDDVMRVGCVDEDKQFTDFIDVRISEYSGDDADDHNLAAFLAMCRPAVVLDLVRRLRAAEQDAARYRWLTEHAYIDECHTGDETILEICNTDRQVPIGGPVDEAIDRAIGKKRSNS